jgi:cob(I)alamin adenosyltransferase
MKLIDRRRQQRDEAVQETLAMCEVLRKVVDGGYADLHARIHDVLTAVQRAERAATQLSELEDVEKYGPNGGRG